MVLRKSARPGGNGFGKNRLQGSTSAENQHNPTGESYHPNQLGHDAYTALISAVL